MILIAGKNDCAESRKAWPEIVWAEISTQLNILRRLVHRGGYDAVEFIVDIGESGALEPRWTDLDAAEAIGPGAAGMAPVLVCLTRKPDGDDILSFQEDGREITNAQACLTVAENVATFIAAERGDAKMDAVHLTIGTGRNALDVEIEADGILETWTAPNMRRAQDDATPAGGPEI